MTSHEVVVETIAATRTRTGLGVRVAAQLDTGSYPIGVSVSSVRMRALPIEPHSWCGSWNYTIGPATDNTDRQTGAVMQDLALARSQALELLSDPSLTGMPRAQLASLIERLSVRQAAEAERRLYHRRDGERLPGARGVCSSLA